MRRKPNRLKVGDNPRSTTLRIIGGRHGGRKLAYSGDPFTRPMKERVREAIFNLLGPRAKGKHAIDLFAGTGALGLEALSRGAERATFIERHFPTAALIRRNIAELDASEICEVHAADTFIWAKRNLVSLDLPWIVFCSPPYDFYLQRQKDLLELIETLWTIAPAESLFVVESDQRFDTTLLPESEAWDTRTYPPAVVSLRREKS